jgi:hypothetical protein
VSLALSPGFSLCLVPLDDDRALRAAGRSLADHDVTTCASAQKISYPQGTLLEYLELRDAFAPFGQRVPTVDEARRAVTAAGPLRRYGFRADGDRWWVDHLGPPEFAVDPFGSRDWAVYVGGGRERRRLEIPGSELACALELLAKFDRTATLGSLATGHPDLLSALVSSGAVVRSSAAPVTLDQLPPLLFVNHSTLFVHDGAHSVIVDPVLGKACHGAVPGRDPAALLALADAVVISHHHWDHLWYETLARIPRSTRFFVPRVREPSFANPPIAPYLAALGFTDVVACDPWDEVAVGDLRVLLTPFHGEPAGLGSRFDALTYRIAFGGRSLYGSLDACHDEAGTMDSVIEQVAARGRVDWFWFGSSDQHHRPITTAARMRRFSNELLDRPDLVRYHPNVDDVARWADALRPGSLVPYAEFLFEGARAPADLRARPGESVPGWFDRYWAHFEGTKIPGLPAWKADLERLGLRGRPVVPLHPMQGLAA